MRNVPVGGVPNVLVLYCEYMLSSLYWWELIKLYLSFEHACSVITWRAAQCSPPRPVRTAACPSPEPDWTFGTSGTSPPTSQRCQTSSCRSGRRADVGSPLLFCRLEVRGHRCKSAGIFLSGQLHSIRDVPKHFTLHEGARKHTFICQYCADI